MAMVTPNGQNTDPQKQLNPIQQQLLAYQQLVQQQQMQAQMQQVQAAQQVQMQAAHGQGQLPRVGVNQVGALNIGAPMFKPSQVNAVASPNAALLQQQQH